jgi:glutaredoxin
MENRRCFIFLLLLFSTIILAGTAPPAFAQIYKWTDEAGNIRFSDTPPAGIKVQKVQGLAPRPQTDAPAAASREVPRTAQPEEKKVKAVMYMTDWCPYCRKAREYLHSLKVNLVEYNVEKNPEKAAEFKAKGGTGVPLIDIEGIIVRGFNAEAIKSAVDEKRKR